MIDPLTLEVYGHVVATDVFGDGYVVPSHHSMQEIKQRLGAESVKLPTSFEILFRSPVLLAERGIWERSLSFQTEGKGGLCAWHNNLTNIIRVTSPATPLPQPTCVLVLSVEEWRTIKPLFENLWSGQDLSLAQAMLTLMDDYGFDVA